jgi:tetratricopeptide (TPR) repeat protein
MKKIFVILFIWVLCTLFVFAGTRAEVISKSGHWLTLNKGSKDGVKIGMIGIVKTIMKENGKEFDINVGAFSMRKIMPNTSEAYITKVAPGMNVGQAKFVVFDEILRPPKIPEPKDTNRKPKPTDSALSKSFDWYLEQGEKEFERRNYKKARKYFEEALKLDSKNLVAKKFYEDCNIFLQIRRAREEYANKTKKSGNYILKGDKYIKSGKIEIGIGYYLMAYKAFPGNKEEIVRKLVSIWEKDKSVKTYLLKDEGEAGKILVGNIYLKKAETSFYRENVEGSNEYIEKAREFLDEAELKELKEKVRSALRNRKGFLQVSVFPFADVYIDDQFIGEVPPLKKIELRTGEHRLKLIGTGKEIFEKTVLIKFNQTTKVHYKFGD